MRFIQSFFLIFSIVLSFATPPTAHAKKHYVTIGTGGITGLYYPTGGAIAKMINKKRKYKIRASVESTGGSVYNINAVMSGDLEFGIAQSDRQYQAVKGLAEWKDKGSQKNLRAICSFHPEVVTLVADAAKIKTLKDLKGKRVNLGNPGSGQRGNALDVLSEMKINWKKDFAAAESLKAAEAPKNLQDDRIDAFFYTIGHPNGNIKEATTGRKKVRFVPITDTKGLLKKYPYYAKAAIPAGLYPMAANNKMDVPSIGVKATLVTSAKVSKDVVYAITKELFDNLKEFKGLHPAFSRLTKKQMLEGLSAPFHPGAEKYFKEVGLLK